MLTVYRSGQLKASGEYSSAWSLTVRSTSVGSFNECRFGCRFVTGTDFIERLTPAF